MIKRRWKVDFKVKRQFVQVTNYPLFICPRCGEQRIHFSATRKVLNRLSLSHISAIKLNNNNIYINN